MGEVESSIPKPVRWKNEGKRVYTASQPHVVRQQHLCSVCMYPTVRVQCTSVQCSRVYLDYLTCNKLIIINIAQDPVIEGRKMIEFAILLVSCVYCLVQTVPKPYIWWGRLGRKREIKGIPPSFSSTKKEEKMVVLWVWAGQTRGHLGVPSSIHARLQQIQPTNEQASFLAMQQRGRKNFSFNLYFPPPSWV